MLLLHYVHFKAPAVSTVVVVSFVSILSQMTQLKDSGSMILEESCSVAEDMSLRMKSSDTLGLTLRLA
jgi:hypothetical protein